MRETELAFLKKQDEARDHANQKIAKVRKEAIEGEKKAWIIFYAPIVGAIGFSIGLLYSVLF